MLEGVLWRYYLFYTMEWVVSLSRWESEGIGLKRPVEGLTVA